MTWLRMGGIVGLGIFTTGMLNHFVPDLQNQWFVVAGLQLIYMDIMSRTDK